MVDFRYITYDLAVCLFNFIISLFFREVRPRGSHRIPKTGPVIFVVAPHANQFVDPILVMKECGRRVSMLIAEKSMHQKGIGFFARMINAIPVVRPQDLATKGKGTIRIVDVENPLHLTGTDTEFTKLLPKDTIVLPDGDKAEVDKVISDTEIILKKGFKSLELITGGVDKYKCIPHVEQGAVYKAVYEELNSNGCITIFPEGGSHDRVEMLPLKAGATIMALGAMAEFPGLDVKIVPVGLNYFHAHKFRSRAVIEFGDPINIPTRYVEMFKNGGDEKRKAISGLLSTMYDALKSVTLNAGSYETLMLIQAARRLYKPAHRKLHISQVVDLNRRFLIGYNLFKDDPRVIDLEQRVLAYNQLLKYHGIKDHQVSKTDLGGRHTLILLLKRLVILLGISLLDFPGAILNLPIIVIARIISAKKAKAALRGSTVKVAGRDVLATWKVLVGLVLVPSLYTFYSICILGLLIKFGLFSLKGKLVITVLSWYVIGIISYGSLLSGDIGLDIAKSLRPLMISAFDPKGAEILRMNRSILSSSITDLINEYGPKAFPDFDAEYINRLSVPPTPTPSRSSSSASFALPHVKLPTIKSGFFNPSQTKKLEKLEDQHLFNWGYSKEDENSNFLGIGQFFNKSRSGSTTPTIQSRSNSFSSSVDDELTNIKLDISHLNTISENS